MTENTDPTPADRDDRQPQNCPPPSRQPDGYLVPDDADPERCPHCGAPFTEADLLALHLGIAHDGDLTDDERARFEDAHDTETEEIRLFRLKALGLLVLLYFGLLIAFSVFA